MASFSQRQTLTQATRSPYFVFVLRLCQSANSNLLELNCKAFTNVKSGKTCQSTKSLEAATHQDVLHEEVIIIVIGIIVVIIKELQQQQRVRQTASMSTAAKATAAQQQRQKLLHGVAVSIIVIQQGVQQQRVGAEAASTTAAQQQRQKLLQRIAVLVVGIVRFIIIIVQQGPHEGVHGGGSHTGSNMTLHSTGSGMDHRGGNGVGSRDTTGAKVVGAEYTTVTIE